MPTSFPMLRVFFFHHPLKDGMEGTTTGRLLPYFFRVVEYKFVCTDPFAAYLLTVCGIYFDLKVTRLEPHFSKYHLKKLCPSFATCRFFQAESMTVFLHKPAMISPLQNERRERNCKHPVLFVFTDGIDQP